MVLGEVRIHLYPFIPVHFSMSVAKVNAPLFQSSEVTHQGAFH